MLKDSSIFTHLCIYVIYLYVHKYICFILFGVWYNLMAVGVEFYVCVLYLKYRYHMLIFLKLKVN